MAHNDDILERLDRHMARSNEHMARSNELMAEVRQEHQLTRREHELNRDAYKRGMELTAHLIERVDRIFERHSGTLQELIEQIRVEGSENRAQIRAQTEAIYRMIARFDGGGGAATT